MCASKNACVFCSLPEAKVIARHGSVFAIRDKFPVSRGHALIIPCRHVSDYFDMNEAERHDADALLLELRAKFLSEDAGIKGFNIGVNCGEAAGQTVPHAHIHLIPRRSNDTPRPQGGVRGVIPGKQAY